MVVGRSNKLADKWNVDDLKADLRNGRNREAAGAARRTARGTRKTLAFHPGLRASRKNVLKGLPKPKTDVADMVLMKHFKKFITEEHTLERRKEEAKRRAEAKYNLGRRWVVDDEGPDPIDLFDLPFS